MRRRKPLRRARPKPVEGQQAALCRTLPCFSCGAKPPSDPAHVRSRGAGGGDLGNVVSLCRRCHTVQHAEGIKTFQERRGLDLEAEAKRLGKRCTLCHVMGETYTEDGIGQLLCPSCWES